MRKNLLFICLIAALLHSGSAFAVGVLPNGFDEADWARLRESIKQDNLEPFGTNPKEEFKTSAYFDEKAKQYIFLYSSDSEEIRYFIAPGDDLRKGILNISCRVDDGEIFYPVKGGGTWFRDKDGDIFEPAEFAEKADVSLEESNLADGVLSLKYRERFAGLSHKKTFSFSLKGRTLVMKVSSDSDEAYNNYSGFSFGRCEGSKEARWMRVTYCIEPVMIVDNEYFCTTYFDRTKSSSVDMEMVRKRHSASSVTASPRCVKRPDSAGKVAPLDETGYITVSRRVLDVLPKVSNARTPFANWLKKTTVIENLSFGPKPHQGVARKWMCPEDGKLEISGFAQRKRKSSGGGRPIVLIQKGMEEVLWWAALPVSQTAKHNFKLETNVKEGDAIYFKLVSGETGGVGDTEFEATLKLGGKVYSSSGDFWHQHGHKRWYYLEFVDDLYYPLSWNAEKKIWEGKTAGYPAHLPGDPGKAKPLRYKTVAQIGRTDWTIEADIAPAFRVMQSCTERYHEFGLRDLLLYLRTTSWNRRADGEGLPKQFPVGQDLGGDLELRNLVAACHRLGYLFGLEEMYVGIHKDEGPEYPSTYWNPEAAVRRSDGRLKGWWQMRGHPERFYATSISRFVDYPDIEARLTKSYYDIDGTWLDLSGFSASWAIDLASEDSNPKTIAESVRQHKLLYHRMKEIHEGPVCESGGDDNPFWDAYNTYYAGRMDVSERRMHGRKDAPVIVDFEQYSTNPIVCNAGLGSYMIFFCPYRPDGGFDESVAASNLRTNDFDLYRATEIAFGHCGYLWADCVGVEDSQVYFAHAFREYYLLNQLQQQYMFSSPSKIRYLDKGELVRLGQAILDKIDFKNARLYLEWDNGLKLYVNRNTTEPWEVDIQQRGGRKQFRLAPNGWLAYGKKKGLLEYACVQGGKRIEYVKSRPYVFACSPAGSKQTIEDVVTDGIVALKRSVSPEVMDLHTVDCSVVGYKGKVLLETDGKCNLNLVYRDEKSLVVTAHNIAAGGVGVVYRGLPRGRKDGLVSIVEIGPGGKLMKTPASIALGNSVLRIENLREHTKYLVTLETY